MAEIDRILNRKDSFEEMLKIFAINDSTYD